MISISITEMIISFSLLTFNGELWTLVVHYLHSRVQAPPSQPCQSLNGNFDSGDISHPDPAPLFLRLTHFPSCEHTEVQTAHPPHHRPSSSEQPLAIQRK